MPSLGLPPLQQLRKLRIQKPKLPKPISIKDVARESLGSATKGFKAIPGFKTK